MAAKSQFWVEKVTRKYNGEARPVWRAIWIDQSGTERSKENKKWRKADAEQYAADMAAQVRGGVYVADRNSATVANAITLWLAQCEERNRPPRRRMSASHLAKCRWSARSYLLPEFGKLKLTQVNAPLVERWARRLVVEKIMIATTARGMVSMLSCALDVAVKHNPPWLALNPLKVARLDLPEKKRLEREVPQDPDVIAVLDSMTYRPAKQAEDLFNSLRVLVYLMAFGGLRENEACGLQWEDIDFDRWTLHVRHGLTAKEGLTDLPKTKAGIRDVDILPILYAELEDHRERTKKIKPEPSRKKSGDRLLARNALAGYVITNRDVRPLMPNEARRHWRPIKARAGLPDDKFPLHTLRAYAGSVWLRDGMDLYKVSRQLGHSSIQMTEDYYLHVIKEIDATRMQQVHQISERIANRYRQLGFQMATAQIPAPAAPILLEAPKHKPLVIDLAEDELQSAANGNISESVRGGVRGQLRAKAYELWSRGMQPADICRKLGGVTQKTLYRWLDEHGVTFVHGHGVDAQTREARKTEARELAEGGTDWPEISRRLGVQISTLQYWARTGAWKVDRRRRNHRSVRPPFAAQISYKTR